jgi:hypothetical protein
MDEAHWRDYAGRLKKVSYTSYDASTSSMATVDVASYLYDSTGRLRAAWDPRISTALKVRYEYETSAPYRLIKITPPGLETVTIGYTGSGQGKVSTVSHAALSPASGTATTTIVYGIPLTTSGGGPENVDATTALSWGQTDVPTMATSIFPADQTPSGTPPSSYTRTTTFYMNAEGQITNVRDPAGGGLSTVEHDILGNVIRELSPQARADALAGGSSPEQKASIALRRDTRVPQLVVTRVPGSGG